MKKSTKAKFSSKDFWQFFWPRALAIGVAAVLMAAAFPFLRDWFAERLLQMTPTKISDQKSAETQNLPAPGEIAGSYSDSFFSTAYRGDGTTAYQDVRTMILSLPPAYKKEETPIGAALSGARSIIARSNGREAAVLSGDGQLYFLFGNSGSERITSPIDSGLPPDPSSSEAAFDADSGRWVLAATGGGRLSITVAALENGTSRVIGNNSLPLATGRIGNLACLRGECLALVVSSEPMDGDRRALSLYRFVPGDLSSLAQVSLPNEFKNGNLSLGFSEKSWLFGLVGEEGSKENPNDELLMTNEKKKLEAGAENQSLSPRTCSGVQTADMDFPPPLKLRTGRRLKPGMTEKELARTTALSVILTPPPAGEESDIPLENLESRSWHLGRSRTNQHTTGDPSLSFRMTERGEAGMIGIGWARVARAETINRKQENEKTYTGKIFAVRAPLGQSRFNISPRPPLSVFESPYRGTISFSYSPDLRRALAVYAAYKGQAKEIEVQEGGPSLAVTRDLSGIFNQKILGAENQVRLVVEPEVINTGGTWWAASAFRGETPRLVRVSGGTGSDLTDAVAPGNRPIQIVRGFVDKEIYVFESLPGGGVRIEKIVDQGFDSSQSLVWLSARLNTQGKKILHGSFYRQTDSPDGGRLQYFLSADGGRTWVAAELGTIIKLGQGSDFRFKVELVPGPDKYRSPSVSFVGVSYWME